MTKLISQNSSKKVISELIQSLENPEYSVRKNAAHILGQIGSVQAVPSLINALEVPDCDFCETEFLKQIRDNESILKDKSIMKYECILKLVGSYSILLRGQASNVRGSAAKALGQIGDERAVSGLLQALRDSNSSVYEEVVKALGKIGSEQAVPELLRALKTSKYRKCIAKALGQIADDLAISKLLDAIEDRDSNISKNDAAEALGQSGVHKAIPGLLKALEDPHRNIRESAAEALGKIGSPLPLAKLWQQRCENSTYYFNKDYLEEAIFAIQNNCKYYNYEIAYNLVP
ncbi:MAG: HEAT repeat domain-containing protein [Leptolyngbyaceae cyanobacterium]